MRRLTSIEDERKLIGFVGRAARCFEDNPELTTYCDGELAEGELLALRWGMDNDCVLVVRLDDAFGPVIYQNEVRRNIND